MFTTCWTRASRTPTTESALRASQNISGTLASTSKASRISPRLRGAAPGNRLMAMTKGRPSCSKKSAAGKLLASLRVSARMTAPKAP